ncbi:MAG: signal peptidase I [Eubacterium sp.]|nr:signal peptidase I [Eubacterium sp.]
MNNNNNDVTEKQPNQKPDNRKTAKKAALHLLIKLAVIALIISLTLVFIFGVFRLGGNNMYPALKDGDLCVTYKLGEYHSDDVVAYRIDDEIRFGRIIARAGDTIDGDEQGILLNGSYLSEEVFYPTQIVDTQLNLPYTLSEGEFVVLNDYRSDQSDSRTYGVINKKALKGKVIFIFRRRGF